MKTVWAVHWPAFSEGDARLAPRLDVAASLGITLIAGGPARLGAALHIGAFVRRHDRTIGRAGSSQQRLSPRRGEA